MAIPTVTSANNTTNSISNSNDIAGLPVITTATATAVCTALVNQTKSSWARTPQILSWPGSVLSLDHPCSVPRTHLPSWAATPLIPTASPARHIGPVAPVNSMSCHHWLESVTDSPDLLASFSQDTHSPWEQINTSNVNSQVSDSSEILGMTLKYSDDNATDEKLRELNF